MLPERSGPEIKVAEVAAVRFTAYDNSHRLLTTQPSTEPHDDSPPACRFYAAHR
jgi:hypothetical protein